MEEPEKDRYWIVPRDKPGLLVAMFRALAGGAHISFEGDLSRCTFPSELGATGDETAALQRQTAVPRQDFVVLPLEPDTFRQILQVVLKDSRVVKDIVHIQIEKGGRLEFGSYDNFHPECVVAFHGVPTDLLNRLQQNGVIRSWTEPYAGATRWHG
jgi:hypothetical protein